MIWFTLLKLILSLASWLAKRVDRAQVEQAVLDALEIKISNRTDDAVSARDDVLSGRVPIVPDDPNRRD